jgi:hypothetical protein
LTIRSKFPTDVVRFVSKTGFITKELWEEYFFAGGHTRWKHQAWANLSLRGYLIPHAYQRAGNVYVLNPRNHLVLDCVAGRMARPPTPALLDHDEILNWGLIGLERQGDLSDWTTEAELKSRGLGPHRIETQGHLIKFPDALVRRKDRKLEPPVAIELERTLKARLRYRQIMSAYGAMKDIRAVLFVCESPTIENAVQESMNATYFPVEKVPVGFAQISDWKSSPSQMEISLGRRRVKWSEF